MRTALSGKYQHALAHAHRHTHAHAHTQNWHTSYWGSLSYRVLYAASATMGSHGQLVSTRTPPWPFGVSAVSHPAGQSACSESGGPLCAFQSLADWVRNLQIDGILAVPLARVIPLGTRLPSPAESGGQGWERRPLSGLFPLSVSGLRRQAQHCYQRGACRKSTRRWRSLVGEHLAAPRCAACS